MIVGDWEIEMKKYMRKYIQRDQRAVVGQGSYSCILSTSRAISLRRVNGSVNGGLYYI